MFFFHSFPPWRRYGRFDGVLDRSSSNSNDAIGPIRVTLGFEKWITPKSNRIPGVSSVM